MIYKTFIKRPLDLLFAFFLLFLLLIPMGLIAVVIKVSSRGPILFKQERYTKNSEPFTMYKFRSMTEHAPIKANSEFQDIESYVTPIGMFIRKTSIDELPQLVNILKGEMSFIGPRPLSKTDKLVLDLRKKKGADSVLPGISGLAQVNGRNNVTDIEKAEYDVEYSKSITFSGDLKIAIKTAISVLKKEDIFKNFSDNASDEAK